MRIWGNGGRRITRQKRGGRDSFKCLGSHVPRGARSLQTAATGPSSKETRAAYDLSVSQSVFTITEKATNTRLWPSPGWKGLLALLHLRQYSKPTVSRCKIGSPTQKSKGTSGERLKDTLLTNHLSLLTFASATQFFIYLLCTAFLSAALRA